MARNRVWAKPGDIYYLNDDGSRFIIVGHRARLVVAAHDYNKVRAVKWLGNVTNGGAGLYAFDYTCPDGRRVLLHCYPLSERPEDGIIVCVPTQRGRELLGI